MKPLWDIFCRVVDNLGDAGVCWRLARQLASEYPVQVRLWIDIPQVLTQLLPEFRPEQPMQEIAGVTIGHWVSPLPFDRVADVVIEAFACDPPGEYLQAMANRTPASNWVNLEYLSAEPWVGEYHLLPSPHSRLPLTKHFFFPGFTTETGGLLRERDLLQQNRLFQSKGSKISFLQSIGVSLKTDPQTLIISLFCYESAPIGELLRVWEQSDIPILCLLPPGIPTRQVEKLMKSPGPWHRGNLSLVPIPLIPQSTYDQLLWSCNLNFVRGEDSFIRSQWALKPLVWNIYPQEDRAHAEKLESFLELYGSALSVADKAVLRRFWYAWNGLEGDVTGTWKAFAGILPGLTEHAESWGEKLAQQQDLAAALVKHYG